MAELQLYSMSLVVLRHEVVVVASGSDSWNTGETKIVKHDRLANHGNHVVE